MLLAASPTSSLELEEAPSTAKASPRILHHFPSFVPLTFVRQSRAREIEELPNKQVCLLDPAAVVKALQAVAEPRGAQIAWVCDASEAIGHKTDGAGLDPFEVGDKGLSQG